MLPFPSTSWLSDSFFSKISSIFFFCSSLSSTSLHSVSSFNLDRMTFCKLLIPFTFSNIWLIRINLFSFHKIYIYTFIYLDFSSFLFNYWKLHYYINLNLLMKFFKWLRGVFGSLDPIGLFGAIFITSFIISFICFSSSVGGVVILLKLNWMLMVFAF